MSNYFLNSIFFSIGKPGIKNLKEKNNEIGRNKRKFQIGFIKLTDQKIRIYY